MANFISRNFISRVVHRLKRDGFARAWTIARSRLYERYREWSLGIDTAVPQNTDTRNFGDENHPYCPLCYSSIESALQQTQLVPGESVLLDYGAGKGRIIVSAATLPFQRVIGVEYCPELSAQAKQNVQLAARKLHCDVEVVTQDAAEYEVPDDVSHVVLFNPFSGSILQRVEQQLIASLQRAQRTLDVYYMYPCEVQDDYFASTPAWTFQGELDTGYWENVRFVHYRNAEVPATEHEVEEEELIGVRS